MTIKPSLLFVSPTGEDIRRLEFSITTDTVGPWTAIDVLYSNTGAFVNPASLASS